MSVRGAALPEIAPLEPADWTAVRAIYEQGLATGQASFETVPPDWETWDRDHLAGCRYVAREGGRVVGWAALSAVSSRPVYSGVAEVSIYVASDAASRGIGKALLTRLIEGSEAAGIWTLEAGIFPENEASLRLHRSCGFREVGRRERLGCLRGVWRDVVLLERRSPSAGCRGFADP